ncbi:1-acyl-sn-glycerol-3-phosphate acyltransferase [Lactobacillus taiwanensis]|uniref:1-acyl-sn-glycerol-3-phosphate acyltransferase n=1 Tax=Lactobacillus taiwanensis TaxID=508451 RepID=UPI000B98175F|nr:1-acyl-sn-glycerol-3-phosphate acyltransferase [Lactobacillus taiwanensis]MCR1903704.1 1-acyl-sn-glycerol-3-phosphate acyltransferase [Lactobacillus taiwanensis]OYS21204.1 1-acyl-sn-glycerol-3-phosphate acyltransferase [Lactobacillus taiwanensis]OYS23163.1 1-acyl-sn-glycerol-3-phosphate acyltransferase [Lactobacillus taiwanensis]OYS24200.1 1-acyl-sn-glycerol-3-phosphate acyltransferase [Lactobacillus taiwanensis]OYS26307.1 1-acyl-sn-glycerol-3-phosphate acyltransferase [Lactobacillus taiwan
MNNKPSKHKTIYYNSLTDDVVKSKQQDFTLPDNYQIIKQNIPNYVMRFLATGFAYLFTYGAMHVKVIGRDKLVKYKDQSYFIYGNHTQMLNDVFMPLTLCGWKNYYAIANQANWGIPVIGKILLPYGGLPVGKTIKQAINLLKAVKALTKENAHIVIYPEAHIWPYFTDIRPFSETSFNFPVQANKASFVMTTTYQKRKYGKHPKITVYIDGPFFPDTTLTKKQQQKKLHDQVFHQLKKRSKMSNYQYYQYQKREIGG